VFCPAGEPVARIVIRLSLGGLPDVAHVTKTGAHQALPERKSRAEDRFWTPVAHDHPWLKAWQEFFVKSRYLREILSQALAIDNNFINIRLVV
jgi:hypothetical protein